LYDARFDPVIGQYLDSIGARNREPSDLNRELFGYGQLACYSYADAQRSTWGDIKLIANSMVSVGQSVLYSGTSDQIGPYDELKLKAKQLFGGGSIDKKPLGPKCLGCWRAQTPDGAWATSRRPPEIE